MTTETKELSFMRNQVIEAYCWVRANNQTIPDEILDFMKDAALEKIKKNEDFVLNQLRLSGKTNGTI